MTKRIAFEPKVDLQIFSRSVAQYDLPPDCQQNWTMKNDQERHARSEADYHPTPKPVAGHLCLILFSHRPTLLPSR
jgi:hypothetical protein